MRFLVGHWFPSTYGLIVESGGTGWPGTLFRGRKRRGRLQPARHEWPSRTNGPAEAGPYVLPLQIRKDLLVDASEGTGGHHQDHIVLPGFTGHVRCDLLEV